MMIIEKVLDHQWETVIAPKDPTPSNSTVYLPQPKKRKVKHLPHQEIFKVKLTWATPTGEGFYNLIIDQRMLYEDPVQFEAINCPILERLLSFDITTYLESINQVRIHKSKLAQFYVNIEYNVEGSPIIISMVNNEFVFLSSDSLGLWTQLPNVGVNLQDYILEIYL